MAVANESIKKTLYVTREISCQIQRVSFVAFIMVVAIHSQVFNLVETSADIDCFFQRFIFRDLTAWAVPYFFVVAGFFFSKRLQREMVDDRLSLNFWRMFYRTKIKTLFFSYVLWTIICTLLIAPIILGANYMSSRSLGMNILYTQDGIADIFGLYSWAGPKNAGHLWFLRTLIILFLISPFFYRFFQFKYFIQGGILVFIYILSLFNLPLIWPLFWFLFGGAFFSSILMMKDRIKWYFSGGGWIVFTLGYMVLSLMCPYLKLFLSVLKVASIFCAILFWARVMTLFEGVVTFVRPTFFYYCVHIIFTTYLTYGFIFLNRASSMWEWFFSIMTLLGGVLGSVGLHKVMHRWTPSLLSILDGGRE